MEHITLNQLTFNKAVKSYVQDTFGNVCIEKKHIACIGYVWFLKKEGKIVGKIYREINKGMICTISTNYDRLY